MTRRLVAVAILVALAAPIVARQWFTRATAIYTPAEPPQAIYIGRHFEGWSPSHAYPFDMEPGRWHTVTLPYLPDGTTAVFLGGLLVNSNNTLGLCQVTATFRSIGSVLHPGNYQMQVIAIPGDGERSNATKIVSVVNKSFEFYWTVTPGCPSLINLTMQQAYVDEPE